MVAVVFTGCSSTCRIPPAAAGYRPGPALSQLRQTVVTCALESLGTPYVWSGTSPLTGFDCSGLVVYAHAAAGVSPPRTARAMFKRGRIVSRLVPGDLVFFNSSNFRRCFHVGIFVGGHLFVHASGQGNRVQRSSLNNPYFKQHFIGARSFL